jgi:hypothetical protein
VIAGCEPRAENHDYGYDGGDKDISFWRIENQLNRLPVRDDLGRPKPWGFWRMLEPVALRAQ